MPVTITAYRVFIATPGNLQTERRAFREALQEYAESEALHRGLTFIPVGWEDTLAGVGRPQEKINEELRSCDYCVVVLWDRWGTPPSDKELKYTSGTEEEFEVAKECRSSPHSPMRDIVVLFKGVDDSKLSDPGPQLKAVLKFKKELENSKEHLYTTFDDTARFQTAIRKLLAQWVRDHEGRTAQTDTPHPPDDAPLSAERQSAAEEALSGERFGNASPALSEALRLANLGQLTEAEGMFAKAVTGGNDPAALIEYSRFLFRLGRPSQAEAMVQRVLSMPETTGSIWQARGLRQKAGLARYDGKFPAAESFDTSALQISTKLGDDAEMARCYLGLSDTSRRTGDQAAAMERASAALKIAKRIDDQALISAAHRSLYGIHLARKNRQRAEEMAHASLIAAERSGDAEEIAMAQQNFGRALSRRGDNAGAEQALRAALEINKKIGRIEGVAKNKFSLAQIEIEKHDAKSALDLLTSAMDAYAKLGKPTEVSEIKRLIATLKQGLTQGDSVSLPPNQPEKGQPDAAEQASGTSGTIK